MLAGSCWITTCRCECRGGGCRSGLREGMEGLQHPQGFKAMKGRAGCFVPGGYFPPTPRCACLPSTVRWSGAVCCPLASVAATTSLAATFSLPTPWWDRSAPPRHPRSPCLLRPARRRPCLPAPPAPTTPSRRCRQPHCLPIGPAQPSPGTGRTPAHPLPGRASPAVRACPLRSRCPTSASDCW